MKAIHRAMGKEESRAVVTTVSSAARSSSTPIAAKSTSTIPTKPSSTAQKAQRIVTAALPLVDQDQGEREYFFIFVDASVAILEKENQLILFDSLDWSHDHWDSAVRNRLRYRKQ